MVKAAESNLDSLREKIAGRYSDGAVLVGKAHALAEAGDAAAAQRGVVASDMLTELRLDPPALAAAMVADAAISGTIKLEAIGEALGADTQAIVDGVRRVATMRWDRTAGDDGESLRKMFMAIAADVRVVIVALALRLRDMRALRSLADEAERRRIARETLEIYAPLANRLGIFHLKWELEDLCLRELEPDIYRQIGAALAAKRDERDGMIRDAILTLQARLEEAGIHGKISGRPKHIYSIYKKMQRKRVSFAEIYDVSAVRVLVDSVPDCYAVLGIVHGLWTPIAGEFDDYIARPKPNGYQSLHTAIVGPGGRSLEVQIRTAEMHQFGEYGVAAHWAYKESRKAGRLADAKFNWLRQLIDWQKEVTDPHDMVESLKTDIFQDQVYVFTPGGDVIDLPVGATAVDFAYRVHTDVGHRCRGALVNGQIVPLDHKLQTGDRVEILTQKTPQPSRDWLSPQLGYVITSSARHKIRQWFRQQGREAAIVQGRESLERELKRVGIERPRHDEYVKLFANHNTPEELFSAIGFGDIATQAVAAKILDAERAQQEAAKLAAEAARLAAAATSSHSAPVPEASPKRPTSKPAAAGGVSVEGQAGVLSHPARCCTPVPGDAVIGYITRGRGIAIHRRDCPNILSSPEPERLIEIAWGNENRRRYPVTVLIQGSDRIGLLRDIVEVFADLGINVSGTTVTTNKKEQSASISATLEVSSNEQLVRVLAKIERVPGVERARRQAG
ncbi:bifunctional (p)ppGpp synthetase/guanosine-3',5'-bis(diphosphate) 3'-pyrophosphohydrolase [Nannocystis pusilla]|uniref:Bifunctional (P)ppGpp synthetase/guanosine-3',5'-bis(Diphosphate) 3'-pyrophosphohydrolase n=1 Tax=Nannocystis pusilla TaxID=889268 RepID=A0A9X3IVI5_9BACT|nr:bifunctional (p)ppGpp synthetase/guanosine-3',5'-bis(diphosphate) 3'-pyrophosphohydrolase [Nannocystis pusilla]MCY1004930.1 bifunctional (p)ppGpp synthetase/guanosine-3',5'-bis(diphosphate) 3'-pyrophosphohydrolase [Nannocystis pusilla]